MARRVRCGPICHMPAFTCPHCSRAVFLPDPWAPQSFTCPHCHVLAPVPGRESNRGGWGDTAFYGALLFLFALAVGLVLIAM